MKSSTPSASTNGLSLSRCICLGLAVVATVKAAAAVYHHKQCVRREAIVRDLVDATEARLPRLLMPPIIINETASTALSTSRSPSVTPASTNPASTTIRILAVTDRRPSLVLDEAHKPQGPRAGTAVSSSLSHTAGGSWHKEEGDDPHKQDRYRLEKALSQVHLFMQPRWTLSPNISPACTMLEAFLRLHQIPYTAHVIHMLNNHDVVGRARETDVPQEDGPPIPNDAVPPNQTSILHAMASSSSYHPGMVRSALQCLDSASAFAQQALATLDSAHRHLPFIVYRGEVVSGSYDTITAYLMKAFRLTEVADDASDEQTALAQALRRTMLFTLDMQYRVSYLLEAPSVFARYAAPAMGCPPWAMWLWVSLPWFSKLKTDTRRALRAHDLGALTRDQFHLTARRDMDLIESLLRNPDYTPSATELDDGDDDNNDDGGSGDLGGQWRQRRVQADRDIPSHSPQSFTPSLDGSLVCLSSQHGATAQTASAAARERYPSRFLFSHDTPSREDCVLYAYLMPMVRLTEKDLASMPAEANDAIRFVHDSDVFVDFVRRMTARLFPDFDRMVCLVLGINPAQLFLSRYAGGAVPVTSRGMQREKEAVTSGAFGVPPSSAASQERGRARAPAARSASPYEDALRASAAATARLSAGASAKATPAPPSPHAAEVASPAHITAAPRGTLSPPATPPPARAAATVPTPAATASVPIRRATPPPRVVTPPAAAAPAPAPAPVVPKLVIPVRAPAQPHVQPAPVRAAATPVTPRHAASTATSVSPALSPSSRPSPAVRYTPSNPNARGNAIRKVRPPGHTGVVTPRV